MSSECGVRRTRPPAGGTSRSCAAHGLMCCTIIEDLLSQLSPSERVLVDAAMAQAAAAAKTTATASSKEVAAMTVPKLKAALKARGLDQSGLKSDLVARLLAEVA